MSRYGGPGTQGGTSLENPKYETYVRTKFLSPDFGIGLPQDFPRITGHQKIVLKFGVLDTSPTCTFSLTGGSNTNQPEIKPMFPNTRSTYNTSINYVPAETAQGCVLKFLPYIATSKSTRTNVFNVLENITGNNWYFTIAMSPFADVPNLIQFPINGNFIGYISLVSGIYGPAGNTLTVLSVDPGVVLRPGQVITAGDIVPGTTIIAGPAEGGPGIYTVGGAPQLSGGSLTGELIVATQQNNPVMVSLKIYSYRGLPYMRESGISVAFTAPQYVERNYTTNFDSILGVNELDSLQPLPFFRFAGQQDIVFTLSNSFYFQFSIDYGILGQANGYIGLVGPNTNPMIVDPPAQNCIITAVSPLDRNQIMQQVLTFLVEDTNAPNNRTYAFTFYPNPNMQRKPTITLVGGPDLGALTAELKVVIRSFATI